MSARTPRSTRRGSSLLSTNGGEDESGASSIASTPRRSGRVRRSTTRELEDTTEEEGLEQSQRTEGPVAATPRKRKSTATTAVEPKTPRARAAGRASAPTSSASASASETSIPEEASSSSAITNTPRKTPKGRRRTTPATVAQAQDTDEDSQAEMEAPTPRKRAARGKKESSVPVPVRLASPVLEESDHELAEGMAPAIAEAEVEAETLPSTSASAAAATTPTAKKTRKSKAPEENGVAHEGLAKSPTPSPTSRRTAKTKVEAEEVQDLIRSEGTSTQEEQKTEDSKKKEKKKKKKKSQRRDRTLSRLLMRRRVLTTISSFGKLLRPLLLLGAFVLLFLLPTPRPPFRKGTYVDENAIQPAHANVYWEWQQVGWADELSREIKAMERESSERRAEFISDKLIDFGLAPQTQSYTFQLPSGSGEPLTEISGVNTYSSWRSGRADGREAIIIACSWLSKWDGSNDPDKVSEGAAEPLLTSGRRSNIRGVASVLALARYLSAYSHWSKDLIFVFSDGYMDGMQAWSNSYFGVEQSNLVHVEPLKEGTTRAVVWNSIAIDYPSDSYEALEVLFEGMDGQLPNMDVVNTIVRIADRLGRVPIRLQGGDESKSPSHAEHGGGWGEVGKWLEEKDKWGHKGVTHWKRGAKNLAQQVKWSAVGHPSGIHGLFQRFHVDAITIYAVPATGPFGFYHIGRIVEASVRSFSNLLERLHHSQFFYLLTTPDHFVQLGVYLPVALLISAVLMMRGLSEWGTEGDQRQERIVGLVDMVWEEVKEIASKKQANGYAHGQGSELIETARKTASGVIDVPLEHPTSSDLEMSLASAILEIGLSGNEARQALATLLKAFDAQSRPVVAALAVMLVCHIVGGGVYLLLSQTSLDCGDAGIWNCGPIYQAATLTTASTVFISLVFSIQQRRSRRAASSPASFPIPHCCHRPVLSLAHLVHSFTLLETSIIVGVLSVLNFSAAMVIGFLLALPLYLSSIPSTGLTRVIPTEGGTEIVIDLPWLAKVSMPSRVLSLITAAILLLLLPFSTLLLLPHLASAFPSLFAYAHLHGLQSPQHLDEILAWVVRSAVWDQQILGTAFVPTLCIVFTPLVLQGAVAALLVVLA